MESKQKDLQLDMLTILCIGIISFIVKNILHEAVGHGGACLLVGGLPISLSTAHFDCGVANVSDIGVRFIAAAGTLVNFIAALLFWMVYRNSEKLPNTLRFFLWLCMSGNYFVGAGYPLFSGILGVGDWVDVVNGFSPAWLWRVLLAVIGLVLYLMGVRWSLLELMPLIGSDPAERLVRAFKLTLFPYFSGAFFSSLGAFLNPIGMFVVFTSMSASFGGSSALAWMSQMLKTKWFPERSDSLITIQRSWAWVAGAVVLFAFHFFVLGPGYNF